MAIFSKQDFKELMDLSAGMRVSLYMPTCDKGAETRQNPIRFKNLLSQVDEKMRTAGLDDESVRIMLSPAQSLLDDRDFWQHQDQGLVLFIAPDFFRYYRLPYPVEELTMVGSTFYIKPLISLLSATDQYGIAAVSQNQVQIFQARRYHIQPVHLKDMPSSLAEALRYDDPEQQIQFHSSSGGGQQAMYHGHGGGEDDRKTDILRFFQQINDVLQSWLAGTEMPLVFVGVDYLFPIYQEANTYPHLVQQSVAANPDQFSMADVHDATWPVIEPLFRRNRQVAQQRYGDLSETNQSTSALRDVLVAAHDGQVETLFVPLAHHHWGTFDAGQRQMASDQMATARNEDLLNLAVVYTLCCDGQVFAVPMEEVPGNTQVAAILRYPMPTKQAMQV